MVNRRIIDQTEAMSLSGDDYLVADNANLGTRKIQFTRLLSGATPLPPNYKTGLGISRVSATTFSVASGYIRSDDNSRNIQLSTSLIKNISATFDLGNNAGCMPSGLTLQANTKYYVFAISTSGGNSDIIVDTSIGCLNGLADNVVVLNNFDKFAKLGYFITNASSQIVLSQIENQDFKVKTGSIIMFGSDVIPDGYLACNGATISRTTYADLFAVIGTRWGTGDGSTTFNLPNCPNMRIARGNSLPVTGNGYGLTLDNGQYFFSISQDATSSSTAIAAARPQGVPVGTATTRLEDTVPKVLGVPDVDRIVSQSQGLHQTGLITYLGNLLQINLIIKY